MARQIESISALGVATEIVEIRGPSKLKYLFALLRVRKRRAGNELIHAHFGFSGWIALCQATRPVVISFMGNDLLGKTLADGTISRGSKIAVRLNRLAARRADAVIVKSEEMARVLHGIPVHIIPNGVDLESFAPIDRAEARRQLDWPVDELVVLFPGNPEFPNKGFAIVRDAVNRASTQLGRRIELKVLWGVPPQRVPTVMSASDVMILASQTEGSPNVVKEALACELPIVATRVGDVPELIGAADGCFLCDRLPEPIGWALAQAITHGRLNCGRRILRERGLDQASVAKRILAVYDEVLAKRRERQ